MVAAQGVQLNMSTKPPTKRTVKQKTSKAAATSVVPTGAQLVIVESPTKAKKLQSFLGKGYRVIACLGHIRDLPSRNPKGVKRMVPGVDVEEGTFEPHYEVPSTKKPVVAELRKLAKVASEIWFATDLDREGEAIAWHLADVLGVNPETAKRVVFNAVTRTAVLEGFQQPRPIDMDRVNAQQARRILDRLVGYQVSPVLWKKVAGGLSAGRVQSVATRLVVERDKEIRAHIPDETWSVIVHLTGEPAKSSTMARHFAELLARVDERGKGPTQREQVQWLADHGGFEAELVELNSTKFELGCLSTAPRDLSKEATNAAAACGLLHTKAERSENPGGKGPAAHRVTVTGTLDPAARFRVSSIERKSETNRPYAPFKTSTMQRAGGSIGFTADRTGRVAQQLYEAGWITYMRTDSLHLAPEAVQAARTFIEKNFGAAYVPDQPRSYVESNVAGAQEAHEAIRPTDPNRTPDFANRELPEEQAKLYGLIWRCFMACQAADAQWERTTVRLERSDRDTGAVLRTSGRTLVFDGFLKLAPRGADDSVLPKLSQGTEVAPFDIDAHQTFSSPPSRFTESSLIKMLEDEGIGRPSTYASIVKTIVDRQYVERRGTSLESTALGEKVTDFLVENFDAILNVGYTREMEKELDEVAQRIVEWHEMLREFQRILKQLVDDGMGADHVKAKMDPAPYACPMCNAATGYRFGKGGRFLSCGTYPNCNYAAPVDREGRPMLPERVNIKSPDNGLPMILRTGRFGQFIAPDMPPAPKVKKSRKKKGDVDMPKPKGPIILNVDLKGRIKLPSPPALLTDLDCPKCAARKLNLRLGKRGPWLGCSGFPKCRGREQWSKLTPEQVEHLTKALELHVQANPGVTVTTMDGRPVESGMNASDFTLPGGLQELKIHPDGQRAMLAHAKAG